MPVLAGQKSKFAVLHIDDDSSSDEQQFTTSRAKRLPKKNKISATNPGELVVHAVPQKPKNRGKKGKKKPNMIVDVDGVHVQEDDFDFNERQFQKELRDTLQKSREDHGIITQKGRSSNDTNKSLSDANKQIKHDANSPELKPNAVEILLFDFDKEVTNVLKKEPASCAADKKGLESTVVSLYRSKLQQTLLELNNTKDNVLNLQNDRDKYRTRYKKLCELLRDVDVKEKVQLMVQLENATQIETELSAQIAQLQGQLEQAKSRIYELEQQKPKN